jgi:hypothetical protein
MIAWGGNVMSRAPEFFMFLGLGLLAVGWFVRQMGVVAVGVVVLIVVIIGVFRFSEREGRRAEYSWRTCLVSVRTIDASTHEPVSNAMIRIVADFDGVRTQTRSGRTDATGVLELECTFPGQRPYGESTLYSDFVRLESARIEVSAEGYAPRKIALDEHFGHPKWQFSVRGRLKRVVVELQAE